MPDIQWQLWKCLLDIFCHPLISHKLIKTKSKNIAYLSMYTNYVSFVLILKSTVKITDDAEENICCINKQ